MHISGESQEITIRSILYMMKFAILRMTYRTNHVQIKVLELIASLHLSLARVRNLHEQLLSPRSVLRRIVLLLARQFTLFVL